MLCQPARMPHRTAVSSKQMLSLMKIRLIKREQKGADMAFVSACCLWVCAGRTKTPWPVIALLNACFMSCPGRVVELWSCLFQQHFHYILQSLFPSLSARSKARKRSEIMFTVLSAWKVCPDRQFLAISLFCPLFIPSLLPFFGRLLLTDVTRHKSVTQLHLPNPTVPVESLQASSCSIEIGNSTAVHSRLPVSYLYSQPCGLARTRVDDWEGVIPGRLRPLNGTQAVVWSKHKKKGDSSRNKSLS